MKPKLTRKDFITQSAIFCAGLPLGLQSMAAMSNSASSPNLLNIENDVAVGKMPISIFSKTLQFLKPEELGGFVAKVGFDGIDLTVRPGGHVDPDRVKEDLPKLVKLVEKEGSKVLMMTTAINDAASKETENIIKTAGDLGIKTYRTDWLNYDPKLDIPTNLGAFKKRLAAIGKLNEQVGIRGDYQNHSGANFGAAVWDLWEVLKDIDSRWIGCQYDIRHATVEAANSWVNGLNLIQHQIGSIVLKDCLWAPGGNRSQLKNVPLGQGMVNFKQYFKLLKQYGLNKPVSLHYEYDLGGAENGAKALKMPKPAFEKAISADLMQAKAWFEENNLG